MLARRVLFTISTAALLPVVTAVIGFSPVGAVAATPPMTTSISPDVVRADVATNYTETFKANVALSNATVRTTIPAGWTAPQTAATSGAGYVVAAKGSCTSVNPTPALAAVAGGATQVAIAGVTCASGARVTLSYQRAYPLKAGTYTFGPTSVQTSPSGSATSLPSPTVKATPGPTSQFAVTASSLTTTAGATYGFSVTPQDAGGDVSSYAGTVVFTSSDHGAATLLPAPTAISGAHPFSATLTTAGIQSITATDSSAPTITGTLSGITVNPAPTTGFTWGSLTPVDGTPAGELPAGDQLSYSLTAKDRYGNVTPGYAGRVLTTSSTDTNAVLPAAYTFVPSTDHGSHGFQLTPMTAGNETYTATDASLSTVTGSDVVAVSVGVAPPTTDPLSATVASLFSQTFSAVGASGTVVWSATSLPSWLSLDASTGVLSGTPTSAGGYGPFRITATDSAAPAHTGFWTYRVSVGQGSQTVTFTSDAPTAAQVGGPTYTPHASASSLLPVMLTVDDGSAAVCSMAGDGSVSFIGVGTCTIDANQAGNADWLEAPQAQQSFDVAAGSPQQQAQTLSFTSTAPAAIVGGAKYTPTAVSLSGVTPTGLSVVLTIDNPATAPCTMAADGSVSFTAVGTCTIDANQSGDATYLAADQVQQVVTVSAPQAAIPAVVAYQTGVLDGAPTQQASFPADPFAAGCPPINSEDGGCALTYPFEGRDDVYFDATSSIDPNPSPSADSISYHWEIYYPFGSFGDETFTDAGITGYHSPVLHIAPDSLPDLSTSGSDIYWRAQLTITVNGVTSKTVDFRFIYASDIPIELSDSCLIFHVDLGGQQCSVTAPQLLPASNTPTTQTIAFTSTAPSAATVGGAPYTPTASADSGMPVTLTVDSTSSSVCSMDAGGDVSFIGVGTCTIDANQSGSPDYLPASQQQTILVT